MNEAIELIRRYVTVTAAAIGAGRAWGTFAAISAKLTFDLKESDALLFAGLPVALLIIVLIWKRLPRILGFEV